MTKTDPPTWAKAIVSIIAAIITIMMIVIILGILTNAIIWAWT